MLKNQILTQQIAFRLEFWNEFLKILFKTCGCVILQQLYSIMQIRVLLVSWLQRGRVRAITADCIQRATTDHDEDWIRFVSWCGGFCSYWLHLFVYNPCSPGFNSLNKKRAMVMVRSGRVSFVCLTLTGHGNLSEETAHGLCQWQCMNISTAQFQIWSVGWLLGFIMLTSIITNIQCISEVEFVHAVTAGGSVKFLPAV